MVDNIMRAVNDFKEGGLVGFSEGFMEIQQFVEKIPVALHSCTAIQEDIDKLGQWAKIFIEPTTFTSPVVSSV